MRPRNLRSDPDARRKAPGFGQCLIVQSSSSTLPKTEGRGFNRRKAKRMEITIEYCAV
jgi:hypothetical protein